MTGCLPEELQLDERDAHRWQSEFILLCHGTIGDPSWRGAVTSIKVLSLTDAREAG